MIDLKYCWNSYIMTRMTIWYDIIYQYAYTPVVYNEHNNTDK